jgi:antitoxin VapB
MARRAKLFKSGGSQAVRLPKEYRFEGQQEVVIHREGEKVILEPVPARRRWSREFLELPGSGPDFPEETLTGDQLLHRYREHGPFFLEHELERIERLKQEDRPLGRVPGLLSHLAGDRPVTVEEMNEAIRQRARRKHD